MKIAMLSIHSCPIGALGTKDTGGMSVYIRELSRELAARGYQIDIYTRLNDYRHKTVIDLYDKVRIVHLKVGNSGHMSKLALYPYLTAFSRAMEAFRAREGIHYDLIHSHYWLSGWLGNQVQNHWRAPHILMFHTLGAVKNMTGIGKPESELRIDTEKQLAKTCHRVLAPTEREKENLMQHYAVPSEQIGIVPCGVNLDHFYPMDKKTARRQLGFKPDESIVLYVGRFDPLKGIDRLLSAVSHLDHHQRLRVVIIGGDGPQAPEFLELQKLSRKLGIQNIVLFAGRIDQENLPPYYSAADVLVVPSYYESFGLVGLESLACGTPVVTTRVGVLENILQEGFLGHVVDNGCPRAMAKGIEKFISNSNPEKRLPDEIRTSVLEFSWAKVATALIDEYSSIAA